MIISQCSFCQHLKPGDSCSAFPDGIPDEILLNELSHAKTVDGDNGIVFKAKDAESQKVFNFLEFGKVAADVVA